jgi:hypothetical protein
MVFHRILDFKTGLNIYSDPFFYFHKSHKIKRPANECRPLNVYEKKQRTLGLISARQPVIKMKGWAELLEKIYR